MCSWDRHFISSVALSLHPGVLMATEKLLGEVFKSAEGKLAHMRGGGVGGWG